jgi:hypothetical protein
MQHAAKLDDPEADKAAFVAAAKPKDDMLDDMLREAGFVALACHLLSVSSRCLHRIDEKGAAGADALNRAKALVIKREELKRDQLAEGKAALERDNRGQVSELADPLSWR